jgi:hypothetical protein
LHVFSLPRSALIGILPLISHESGISISHAKRHTRTAGKKHVQGDLVNKDLGRGVADNEPLLEARTGMNEW